MTLLCSLFGHRPELGYNDREGERYLRVIRRGVDGIGREHAAIYATCRRCGREYKIGNIHVPKD